MPPTLTPGTNLFVAPDGRWLGKDILNFLNQVEQNKAATNAAAFNMLKKNGQAKKN